MWTEIQKNIPIYNIMKNNFTHKILVVDDVPINVLLLKRILEKANYEVFTATNGTEALKMMKSEQISLVLLDIRMPELDGIEVLEQKSQQESIKNIPVIMVSAFSERNVIEESLQKGAIAYLKKPIDRNLLMIEMNKILS